MSSVISGVGKVFSAVGSTAAKVTSSVAGVGATVFTAGAANGTSMFRGGFNTIVNSAGNGAVRNVLTGAAKQAGQGGALSQVASGAGGGGLMGGLGGLLENPIVGGAIGGFGEGLARKQEIDAIADEKQRDRDFLQGQRDQIRDSYNVDPSAYQPRHVAAHYQPEPEFDPATGRIKVK